MCVLLICRYSNHMKIWLKTTYYTDAKNSCTHITEGRFQFTYNRNSYELVNLYAYYAYGHAQIHTTYTPSKSRDTEYITRTTVYSNPLRSRCGVLQWLLVIHIPHHKL